MPPVSSPSTDRIKTEYHPSSGRQTHIDTFEDYRAHGAAAPPPEPKPWKNFFSTLEDFEFSELVLEGALSEKQIDRLVKLFRRCLDGKGELTFARGADVSASWDRVAEHLAPVRQLAGRS